MNSLLSPPDSLSRGSFAVPYLSIRHALILVYLFPSTKSSILDHLLTDRGSPPNREPLPITTSPALSPEKSSVTGRWVNEWTNLPVP